jgi:hypothetical protein
MPHTHKKPHTHKHPITIQDLYPDLTPEQQAEAEEHLLQFLEVLKGMYERKHGLSSRPEDGE